MTHSYLATSEVPWPGHAALARFIPRCQAAPGVPRARAHRTGARLAHGFTELSMHRPRRRNARDGDVALAGADCPPAGGRVRSPLPLPVSRGAQPNRPGARPLNPRPRRATRAE